MNSLALHPGPLHPCRFPLLPLLLLCALLLSAPAASQERWNYVRVNLRTEEGTEAFVDILDQSRAVGIRHVLINESGYLRLADDLDYRARVERVKAEAAARGIEIVPAVYPFGYSGRYLGWDRNLAAGLPVRDMPLVVRDGVAIPEPGLAPDLSGLDSTGTGPLAVRPFTHYRVTFFLDAPFEGRVSRLVDVRSAHRRHARAHARVTEDGSRHKVTTTFNSLEADSVHLVIRAEAPIRGLIVTPLGPLMILRRPLTPLVVTGADGRVTYEEGSDFEPVTDPVIATSEGEMTMDHPAPDITLTQASRIRNGDTLRVSYFHAYRVLDEQDVITLEDPAVYELMRRDIDLATRVWAPSGYFMNYDEIRVGGWERPDRTPGQTLAEHVARGIDIVRERAPKAAIYTWSDMFTPHHNARPFEARKEYYYLVNGNFDGAWEGLPSNVVIMNWYAREKEAAQWFADRGHLQILCGYYDARDEERLKRNVDRWKRVSDGVPGVIGVMYTTWTRNWTHLPRFFELWSSYDSWGPTYVEPPSGRD